MLKYNSYPPEKGRDIELSRTSQQDLTRSRNDMHLGQVIRHIGKNAGHQLACVDTLNMESINMLASELCTQTDGLDSFEKTEIFLDGVEEGAAVELALKRQAQRFSDCNK